MTHAYGKNLLPATVGFDRLLSTMEEFDKIFEKTKTPTYPPYNIVKQSEDAFSIELAVAGFKDGEVTITTERNQLVVKGEQVTDLDDTKEYLHKGISARNFVRTWTLADHVEVRGAEVANGILTINLERVVPEEQKPKSIAITYKK